MRKLIALTAGLGLSMLVFAHGDHMALSMTGPKGPVILTPAQEKMLQLTVAHVNRRTMVNFLHLNGKVQLLPDAQADVSVRISGSVTQIDVDLGHVVKKGQRLAVIQSRLVGDPPPSVAVLAPMDGLIDARNINLGQSVDPTTLLFHVSQRDQLLVIAQVYEEDIGKVKIGQNVQLRALSYKNRVFQGVIHLVEPNLDPLTRTVNVRILLSNPEHVLKPGMFVRANVILDQHHSALTIPSTAILHADGKEFVFIQKGHRYECVSIQTGAVDHDVTEVISGLDADCIVVTQGLQQLYTLWLSGGKIEREEN